MTNQQAYDPMADAMNPRTFEPNRDFWGQVQMDIWSCTLEKGVGKVPYDPNSGKEPVTAIKISILTLPEMGNIPAAATERETIANSKEWQKFTLDSLRQLGVTSISTVANCWAHLAAVPTGETYTKNGQEREKTMFRFIQIFPNEQACRDDYFRNKVNGGQSNPAPATAPVTNATPAPDNGNGNKEKETAKGFLRPILENALRGVKSFDEARMKTAEQLPKFPLVSKHFTVDSPEVINMIMEQMSK